MVREHARPVHGLRGQLPVQRGKLVAQVCRDHEVPVSVLPVIPVAELSRPTLAAPVMLSELPDTVPVDDSVALARAQRRRLCPRRPRPW